jgi:dolichol-phosphate mannosyltransferase
MPSVVVLPTYNEAENIVSFLTAIRKASPTTDILVVDDNSPDGTGELADAAADALGQIKVLHRPGKQGLGSAYREGFSRVLNVGSETNSGVLNYDVIISMDADFSHDPAQITDFVERIAEGADIIIGSRYVTGGGTTDWPVYRQLLSRWGNAYTRTILGLPARDCTSGYRAYRSTSLAAIDPTKTSAEGYAFLTELVLRLTRGGASVVEVPIIFRDRTKGKSKMSARIIAESMLLVTRWGVRDRTKKIFRRR